MKFYLAPLEGITGYIYRNALEKYFPGTDRYFTPFIVPDQKRTLRRKELRDILPANNHVDTLIPQILTNDAQRFKEAVQALGEYGYREFNLNLGCPSGTVVTRKRGAGLLAYPEELDRFLDQIFSENQARISVKTRIGMERPEEAYRLMEIYNRYPLSELIIHPRTRQEFYRGAPHLEVFEELLPQCRMPVCYNGNLMTVRDYENFTARFPQVESVMLGRGVIADPGLIQKLKAKAQVREQAAEAKAQVQEQAAEAKAQVQSQAADTALRTGMEKDTLRAFHDEVFAQYREAFGDDNNAVFRMKEMWTYLIHSFADAEKHGKKIRKAKSMNEYLCEVDQLFRCRALCADGPAVWNLPQK